MYPDIIPPKIFPCGAIAKKKQTQNIYNDARSIGDHSFVCFFFREGLFLEEGSNLFEREHIFFIVPWTCRSDRSKVRYLPSVQI